MTSHKSSNRAVILFDDDGPGIPPEHYRNVFKPFFRLDKSRSLNKSGVGLGLAIVEDIINSHLNHKRRIKFENFLNLKDALKRVFQVIKKDNSIDKTILFSPSAASFDFFKNFEERGFYFNKLIKKHLNGF